MYHWIMYSWLLGIFIIMNALVSISRVVLQVKLYEIKYKNTSEAFSCFIFLEMYLAESLIIIKLSAAQLKWRT